MSGGRVDLIIKLPPPSTTFMTALSGSDLAQRNFSCIFCQKRIPMFVVAFLKLGGKVFKKSISSPGNKQTKKTRNKLFTFYPLFTLHMKVGIANWMTKWGCPNLSVSLTTVQISLSLFGASDTNLSYKSKTFQVTQHSFSIPDLCHKVS